MIAVLGRCGEFFGWRLGEAAIALRCLLFEVMLGLVNSQLFKVNEIANLTEKQKRFCQEYIIDLNATQAYIRAGYKVSPEVASVNCRRLLANPSVLAYISELNRMREIRTKITQDRILKELASIGFCRVTDVVSFSEDTLSLKDSDTLSDDAIAAIAEVNLTQSGRIKRTSVKMHDKMQALKMLAEHLGMFNDFESAVRVLANKYGLVLKQNDEGQWIVEDKRVSTNSPNTNPED